jgi:23S rRNA pseudouridine1911/1915/1917 synthase
MKIKIIQEKKDYLIIDKPANLIVHGGKHIKEETLADILLEKYPEIKEVGEDPYRPGIVHRLDKDASGLMIITRNQDSFKHFKKQFQERKIKKEYIALSFGQIEKNSDIIDFPIKRSSGGHKMAALPKSVKSIRENKIVSNRDWGNIKAIKDSRSAITNFSVIERFVNFTLLKVSIETGRTHQVRVHLSAYGHPLLGDNLYGNKKSKIKNKKLEIDRIFLMANKLGFFDLNNIWQEEELSLGEDLKKILKKVK